MTKTVKTKPILPRKEIKRQIAELTQQIAPQLAAELTSLNGQLDGVVKKGTADSAISTLKEERKAAPAEDKSPRLNIRDLDGAHRFLGRVIRGFEKSRT